MSVTSRAEKSPTKKIGGRLNSGVMASKNSHHCTPPVVLDRVRLVDEIGLDPCSNSGSIVGARVSYDLERGEDGLVLPWRGFGLVFKNPPYGDQIVPFIQRAMEYGTRGVEIVGLVPGRIDTAWFRMLRTCTVLLAWNGRLQFLGARGPAPFPSVLPVWTRRPQRWVDAFADVATPWMPG